MSNLVDEYFKRDLTEAEEKQLADWLASSPEDAQRMAQGLADMYAKSGLPEPVWPGGTLPIEKSKWLILKPLAPLLMILSLAGFTAYKWLANMPNPSIVDETVVTPLPVKKEKAPLKKIHAAHKAPSAKTSASPENESALKQISKPAQAQVPMNAPAADLTLPALPSNPVASTAPPAAQSKEHVYHFPSVVVTQATTGLVTVKVKDNLDTEIRTLYAGVLPQGQRTFIWDFKTDLGAMAPPGTYFIEAKSGEKVMKWKVNVEGESIP